MKFPLKQRIISGYKMGDKTFYNTIHRGNDYRANYEILTAPENGQIIYQGYGAQGGFWLHFLADSGYLHKFAHLSKFIWQIGEYIPEGDRLAITGNSGAYTKSPHLHYEVWKEGKQFNPEIIYNQLKKNMTNTQILKKGTEYGFYLPAKSPEALIDKAMNFGIEIPLMPDSTVDWDALDKLVAFKIV